MTTTFEEDRRFAYKPGKLYRVLRVVPGEWEKYKKFYETPPSILSHLSEAIEPKTILMFIEREDSNSFKFLDLNGKTVTIYQPLLGPEMEMIEAIQEK